MIERLPPSNAAPCVVVRARRDVALAAGAGRPVTLLSARGAASFAGALAWMALARDARAAFAGLIAADILDCADAPGHALEALRLGQHALVLDADALGFADITGRAAMLGARILPVRPPAFDPGPFWRHAPALEARLAAFLDTHIPVP